MKSRLCLRILLLRAYDAINDGADTFFRVLVFAAVKPTYAKASAFAICYRRRALRYGGQDGGQVGSASRKVRAGWFRA